MNRPWAHGCAKQSTVLEILSAVNQLSRSMAQLSVQMGKLMTQDATVLAAVQAMEADLTQAATVLTNIQAAVAALQAEVAAGGSISDATMTELNNAKAQADSFLGTISADADADNPTPPASGA